MMVYTHKDTVVEIVLPTLASWYYPVYVEILISSARVVRAVLYYAVSILLYQQLGTQHRSLHHAILP